MNDKSISVRQIIFILITLMFSTIVFSNSVSFSSKFNNDSGWEKKYLISEAYKALDDSCSTLNVVGVDTTNIEFATNNIIECFDNGWVSIYNISKVFDEAMKLIDLLETSDSYSDFLDDDNVNNTIKIIQNGNLYIKFIICFIILGIIFTISTYLFNKKTSFPFLPFALAVYIIIILYLINYSNNLLQSISGGYAVFIIGSPCIFMFFLSIILYIIWIATYNKQIKRRRLSMLASNSNMTDSSFESQFHINNEDIKSRLQPKQNPDSFENESDESN